MLDHAQQVCKALRNAAEVLEIACVCVCGVLLAFWNAVLNEKDKQKIRRFTKRFGKSEMGGEGA